MRGSFPVIAMIAVAGAFLTGCGGDEETTATETTATSVETTTGATGATGADGAEAGDPPAEEDLTACLEDLGHSVDYAGGFDEDYGLQINSGSIQPNGGDLYVYATEKDADKAVPDLKGAYTTIDPEVIGTSVLLYSPDQTQIREDVAECFGG
jgi:hypothetical protein